IDQLGDTIDIAREVVDVLALIDFPRDAIYRFVRVNVRRIRSAPLKIFQEFEAYVLILLSRLVSIEVERGEKAVERGLSENPFAFGWDFGKTHVLTTLKRSQVINFLSLRTPFLIEVRKSAKHYKLFAARRSLKAVFASKPKLELQTESGPAVR